MKSIIISFTLLFLLQSWTLVIALSTPSSTTTSSSNDKRIQRVAIIGSGIAGLSLAHALENSPSCAQSYVDASGSSSPGIETHIFDSREKLNYGAGAGIQLTGGMATLRKINPNLQKAIAKASLPMKNIRSRAKPWSNSDDTNKKPFDTLLEMNLEQVIRKAGGDVESELIVDGEVMAYSIMRGALQEALLNELPPQTSKRIQFGKTLVGIQKCDDKSTPGIMCQFSDGTSQGPFDLVVGCDGIQSAVKEYIERGEIANNRLLSDKSGTRRRKSNIAIYSGIRIQYAVQDGDTSDEKVDSTDLCQYFGDGAYALGGIYGAGESRPPTKGAFLIFKDENYNGPFRKTKDDSLLKTNNQKSVNENADWTQDVESVGETMYQRLKESGVPDIQVGPTIQNGDRFFELGVYFHNPFSLRGWSREVKGTEGRYLCLAGDAAHAMPPFLGQGSNQAIQDAYSLAKTIYEYNAMCVQMSQTSDQSMDESSIKNSNTLLKQYLKDYEHKRWLPTASITAKAAFLGYLETGNAGFLSKFRDGFFFVAGKIGLASKVFLDAATPKV